MRRKRRIGAMLLALLPLLGPGAAGRAAADAAEHRHGEMQHGPSAAPMESMGERIFEGNAGPWKIEVRLIDMKAQLEKSGVSAAAIAKLAAKHHLMVILTDPGTGKPLTGVTGEVTIDGPERTSASTVALVSMGGHIGADVALPKPGKYAFRVSVEGAGRRGHAAFEYKLND